MFRSNRLEQQAGNCTGIRATRIGAGGDRIRMQHLGPYSAAIEGTLPRCAAEGQRFWGSVVRAGIGAEEMRNDLEVPREEADKERSFRTGAFDRPGCSRRARGSGQANISLSAHRM